MSRQFAEGGKIPSQGFSCVEYLKWLFKILPFGEFHILFQVNKIIFLKNGEAHGIVIFLDKASFKKYPIDF